MIFPIYGFFVAESGSSESLEAARQEMVEALKLRKSGLQEKLAAKTDELRLLCLREGELTGELPPEYPIVPGQAPPTVRKRVGTSFALDESIINRIINKQVRIFVLDNSLHIYHDLI